MALLFLLALLLAWPTGGLSLVGWGLLVWMKSGSRSSKIKNRETRKIVIEPLFNERFAEFTRALDIPMDDDREMSDHDAHAVGRHIMNYIAHNKDESVLFVTTLTRMAADRGDHLLDPVEAAEDEHHYTKKGFIHLIAYRAIQTIMSSNRLACFSAVDEIGIMKNVANLELDMSLMKLKNAR